MSISKATLANRLWPEAATQSWMLGAVLALLGSLAVAVSAQISLHLPFVPITMQTFAVVAGTTGEKWLAGRMAAFQIDAKVDPVASYEAGIKAILDRNADVFFGDRPILWEEAAASGPSAEELVVLDRLFTHDSLALGIRRGDEDFRLAVDRSLSHVFQSDGFGELYTKWFGTPDEPALAFFEESALPD